MSSPILENWKTALPYVAPPVAASAAIIPVFRDMVIKSALQLEQKPPRLSVLEGIKQGIKASPTIGAIVGTQMVVQEIVAKCLARFHINETATVFGSAGIVGMVSAPALAIFNGQTFGWSVREALRRMTWRQAGAISAQETFFVAGVSAAKPLAKELKDQVGDNVIVDYVAAFLSGSLGSLAGHPCNTALTRWQNGMTITHLTQAMNGAAVKARAVGLFAVLYTAGKNALDKV